MTRDTNFDVIIVGGSYAGLSAAMALGRSLRNVLIIDGGKPCNRQTPHSHNFITLDGEKPSAITEKAKSQVLAYETVTFVNDIAVTGNTLGENFQIITQSEKIYTGKKVIFATGIHDVMPNIKGFSSCWGISVVHCPYCHGYEIRNKKTGLMANGDRAMHLASLVHNLTDDLTVLTNGPADFNEEQLLKLQKNNIRIIEKEISEIEHENGYIRNVIFKDGSKEGFDATYASLPFTQHSDIPAHLGCELNEQGYIEVDAMQKTTVPGLFACGDNTTRLRSVASAVAEGNKAGAIVNMELAHEEF